MSKKLSAIEIKKLAGQTLSIGNISGSAASLQFPATLETFAGGEGVAIVCDVEIGQVRLPSVFKAFRDRTPERLERSRVLVRKGLANLKPEWMFQGSPYIVVNEIVDGTQFTGHVAQFVGMKYGAKAETLFELRETGAWDRIGRDERAQLAADIASAVAALESEAYVHGDLSLENIMIGPSNDNRAVAVLIDFDGFVTANAPRLPRANGQRPLGNDGFVSPEMLALVDADVNGDNDDVIITSDRFALAVTCCEMMSWSSQVEQELKASKTDPRHRLLSDRIVRTRSLAEVPKAAQDAWPEGFDLLQHAMLARTYADMPSPSAWIDLLVPPAVFRGTPLMRLYRGAGPQQRVKAGGARLRTAGNSLEGLNQNLRKVRFERNPGGALDMRFDWPDPIIRIDRKNQQSTLPAGIRYPVRVLPGDTLMSGGWVMTFEDEPLATV